MGYTEKFGKFVQKRRREIGMTQKELTLKIFKKINISYISKLENGTLNGISLKTIEKILDALGSKIEFKGSNMTLKVKNPTFVQTGLFD